MLAQALAPWGVDSVVRSSLVGEVMDHIVASVRALELAPVPSNVDSVVRNSLVEVSDHIAASARALAQVPVPWEPDSVVRSLDLAGNAAHSRFLRSVQSPDGNQEDDSRALYLVGPSFAAEVLDHAHVRAHFRVLEEDRIAFSVRPHVPDS